MLTKNEFFNNFNKALDIARSMFVSERRVLSVAVLDAKGGTAIVPLDGAPSTNAAAGVVKLVAKLVGAYSIIHITEAWTLCGSITNPLPKMPISENPERVEAVIATGECRLKNGTIINVMAKAPIKRGSDAPTLGEFEIAEVDHCEGTFVNLLSREPKDKPPGATSTPSGSWEVN